MVCLVRYSDFSFVCFILFCTISLRPCHSPLVSCVCNKITGHGLHNIRYRSWCV